MKLHCNTYWNAVHTQSCWRVLQWSEIALDFCNAIESPKNGMLFIDYCDMYYKCCSKSCWRVLQWAEIAFEVLQFNIGANEYLIVMLYKQRVAGEYCNGQRCRNEIGSDTPQEFNHFKLIIIKIIIIIIVIIINTTTIIVIVIIIIAIDDASSLSS